MLREARQERQRGRHGTGNAAVELARLCEKGEDEAACALLDEGGLSPRSCVLALRALGRGGFKAQKAGQRLLAITPLEASDLVELLCAAARRESQSAWIHWLMQRAVQQSQSLDSLSDSASIGPRQESPLCVAAASGAQSCLRALLLYQPGQTQLDGAMSLALNHKRWSVFFCLLEAGGNAKSRCAQAALAFCDDAQHRYQAFACLRRAGVSWDSLLFQSIDLRCATSFEDCARLQREEEGRLNWTAPWRAHLTHVIEGTSSREFTQKALQILAREESLELRMEIKKPVSNAMAAGGPTGTDVDKEKEDEQGRAGNGAVIRRPLRL